MEVIDDLFNSRDVELIKRVPIPMTDKKDAWFWILDDKGLFTVKSCYKWLQGEFDNTNRRFWNKLWSLQLPGKVSQFLWRVCTGCLPTVSTLASKQVVQNIQCPWYWSEIETDTHVLFTCDFARTVWHTVGLQQVIQALPHETAFMIFCRVFEKCTNEQCVLMGMISWGLWNRRNNWVWERINELAFGVRMATTNVLANWKEAQSLRAKKGTCNELGDRIWRKAMDRWVKVNTDVAVFNDGSIGVGCVIENS